MAKLTDDGIYKFNPVTGDYKDPVGFHICKYRQLSVNFHEIWILRYDKCEKCRMIRPINIAYNHEAIIRIITEHESTETDETNNVMFVVRNQHSDIMGNFTSLSKAKKACLDGIKDRLPFITNTEVTQISEKPYVGEVTVNHPDITDDKKLYTITEEKIDVWLY